MENESPKNSPNELNQKVSQGDTNYKRPLREWIREYGRNRGERIFKPLPPKKDCELDALARLLQPWGLDRRPGGYAAQISALLGVTRGTVFTWCKRQNISAHHMDTLAAYCRVQAGKYLTIAEAFERRAIANRERIKGLTGMHEVGHWDGPDKPARNRLSHHTRAKKVKGAGGSKA